MITAEVVLDAGLLLEGQKLPHQIAEMPIDARFPLLEALRIGRVGGAALSAILLMVFKIVLEYFGQVSLLHEAHAFQLALHGHQRRAYERVIE